MGSLSLLQGILPTQGSNPGLLHCRRILYRLSQQGSPRSLRWRQAALLRPAGLRLSALGSSVNCLPPVLPRPLGHNQPGEAGRRRPWSLGLVPLTPRSRACRAVGRLMRGDLGRSKGAVLELPHFRDDSRSQVGALLEPGPRDAGVCPLRGRRFWGSSQRPPLPRLAGGGERRDLAQESGAAPSAARGCCSGPRALSPGH